MSRDEMPHAQRGWSRNVSWRTEDLFCHDLATSPQPGIGRILVTGATGYIGGRLVPELLARGYRVRVMVRAASQEHAERWPGAEIVVADAHDLDSLRRATEGCSTIYFLVHSLLLGPENFESADIRAASNFRKAAEEQGVQRIIYLGALGDVRTPLSPHLRSRLQVAQEIQAGKVPATILRAAVIIGSGSASYELIHHVIKNSPVILLPPWAKTRCQPIGIRDVIKTLVGVLEIPATAGKSFDIGGGEILSYEMMLRSLANMLGKKRLFIPGPFFGIGFYAYIVSFLTPVPAPIARSLMAATTDTVICENSEIDEYLPFRRLTYKEAVLRAMSREERDDVRTRWSDAYPPTHELAMKLRELERPPQYTSTYSLDSERPASALFRSFCSVGGTEGWFHGNWAWRLAGILTRVLMGVGVSRGRRSSSSLRINDVIDFWRVEGLQQDKMLLLRSEMKLPGRAWLEFRVAPRAGKNRLSLTTYFEPRGLAGRAHWYIFVPLHYFIFVNLIRQIEQRS
jgi:uncharacterized protein YbjT (DUF2867 family)